MVAAHIDERSDDRDMEGLMADVATILPLPPEVNASALSQLKPEQIEDRLIELTETLYEEREKEHGSDNMRVLERILMIRTMDNLWVEHLTAMENMRQEAGWQTLRQMKAVDAYKNMGYEQFQMLMDTIRHDVTHAIFHVGITRQAPPPQVTTPMAQVAAAARAGGGSPQPRHAGKKIGRNDPCPCGSGKKYKHCHGR